MTALTTSLAIANYFIKKSEKDEGIQHLKLQKLTYFVYGWWLISDFKEDLIEEKPEVWRYGPVFNILYQQLRLHKGTPIKEPQSDAPFSESPSVKRTDVKKLLTWIWNKYGHLSAKELSAITHEEGTAWSRVAKENNYEIARSSKIPDEYIREEFLKLKNQSAPY